MNIDTLTHVIYFVIVIVFVAAISGVVIYSRRQTAFLKEAVRGGARPHSTQEGIIMAHEQAKKGTAKK